MVSKGLDLAEVGELIDAVMADRGYGEEVEEG